MKNTENSKRIVTAIILGSVTLSAVLFLQSSMFAIAMGLMAAAGAWEWCQLGRGRDSVGQNIVFIFWHWRIKAITVSYTHLTLPTILLV